MDAHNMNIVHIHTLEPCEFFTFPFLIIRYLPTFDVLLHFSAIPFLYLYVLIFAFVFVFVCVCCIEVDALLPLWRARSPGIPLISLCAHDNQYCNFFLIYFTVNIPSFSCFKINFLSNEKKKGQVHSS